MSSSTERLITSELDLFKNKKAWRICFKDVHLRVFEANSHAGVGAYGLWP